MAEIQTPDLDTKKVGSPVETSVPNPAPLPVSSLPVYVAPRTPPPGPPRYPHPPPGPPPPPPFDPEHPPRHPPDHPGDHPPGDHPPRPPHHPVPEWRTINFTIQINFPGTWRWPRCKRRRRDTPPPPPPPPGVQAANVNPAAVPRRGFRNPFAWFVGTLVLFYTSFLICGAVSWGIRSNAPLNLSEAVVIISTFTPIVDSAAVGFLVHLLRRNPDNAKPGFRWVFAILFNEIMFIFHLVVMIFAAVWADQANDYNPYYWNYNLKSQHEAIAGMTLYSSVTMLFIKFCLLFHILRWADIRKTVKDSFTQLCGDECEYTKVSNYDPDARNVRESVDAVRRSEEGRIYLS